MLYYRELPSQMAHSLFNYLIGYVMFYVRTPQTYGQEAIAGALALLWQVGTERCIVSMFRKQALSFICFKKRKAL